MLRKLSENKEGIRLIPISDLLEKYEENFVAVVVSSFTCKHDKDIESFLHDRAVEFELLGKSRTYLLCDDNTYRNEGRIEILGFFTAALKVLDLPDNLSNNKRKMLDGFSAKLRGEVINAIPCYLIGQIAKNSSADNSVSGDVLLEYALWAVMSAARYVGGRYVMIECRETPYLRKYYERNGFEEFDQIPDEGVPVVQMLRPVFEI